MKPFNTLEASAVAQAALSTKDNAVGLAVVFSDDGQAAGMQRACVWLYVSVSTLFVSTLRDALMLRCSHHAGQFSRDVRYRH